MTTAFLVSCVSVKLDRPAPAAQMYISPWFRLARAQAQSSDVTWWGILSAKYGLLDPGHVIEPYEQTLMRMMAKSARLAWAQGVAAALAPRLEGVDEVVVLAGARYREFLLPLIRRPDLQIHVPLEGLAIGKQLQRLSSGVPLVG